MFDFSLLDYFMLGLMFFDIVAYLIALILLCYCKEKPSNFIENSNKKEIKENE